MAQLPNKSCLNLEKNVHFVTLSVHYGHQLSLLKYSNTGWDNRLHFVNGGIPVNLLTWNHRAMSRPRRIT